MRHAVELPEISPKRYRIRHWLVTLWPFIMEYRWRVIFAFGCLIAAKLASVGLPFLLKYQVDHLADLGENAAEQWWLWFPLGLLLAYGAVRFLTVFLGEVRDLLFGRVTERTMRRMSLTLFEHLHKLSLAFHLDRQTGALQRDIERGTQGISFLMRFMIFNIIPTFFELFLVIGVLLFNYPPVFSVITVVAVGLYIAFSIQVTEWRTQYVREANKMDSTSHAKALDSLLNYETVKYFTAEKQEAAHYDKALAQWETARRMNRFSLFSLNSGQALIVSLAMAAMLLFAAYYVVIGEMTLGDFTLVNAFMFQLFAPLNFLGFVYREIKASVANIERMFELLDEKPSVQDNGTESLSITQGQVEFQQLCFAYQENRPILRSLSLVAEAGKTLAVVGASGAGKSTLTKLLFRFYDPDQGRVCIDGQDIRSVPQHQLRQALGIVPQEPVLFNASLRENLLYAKAEAKDEEVQQVLEMAQLSALVASLPEGLNTMVGERGLKLSGGEKQRVAIARMLLKNPQIMLFDEATSSLDSASEQSIIQAIKQVAKNRTALIIAHRLSTVVDADSIAVLDQGQLVEQGTHQELLAKNGRYAQLWKAQSADSSQAVSI